MLTHTYTWYTSLCKELLSYQKTIKILALWEDHSFHFMSYNEMCLMVGVE